jgi:broad specificity phosphatase PhoE
MITYFVHSTSTDNEAGIRSGWNDPDLSLKGYEQAERLRSHLVNTHFDAIYTSDLRRTIHTAQAALLDAKIVSDSRLREMNYGALNGKADNEFPEDESWCIENRYDEGENCRDVEARIAAFLDDVYEPSKHIAIFSHKFPQLALEVILNGLPWQKVLAQDWRLNGDWKPGWSYDRHLTCS